MSLDDLLSLIKEYNPSEVEKVKKAYDYAEIMHRNQLRQSGEPYIIHPLNVAYILATLHADGATLCAGLLHDTLEDTTATKEELIENFGELVADLVDGVTNFPKSDFNDKEEEESANTRKIVSSLMRDPRIIIIKLADRLHNMRTLNFKSPEKRIKKSLETLGVYVPLAYYIGVNGIKSELEDLSLKYLKPDEYKKSEEIRNNIEQNSLPFLENMVSTIHKLLKDENIPNEIKIRVKNIYGVYKRKVAKTSDSHDLIALKVMVDEVKSCYCALGLIHSLYHPINYYFKDFICSPKPNGYSSLHSTVFGDNSELVQMQVRTFDMDFIATYGLPAYWDLTKEKAKGFMQNRLTANQMLMRTIREIDCSFPSDKEFVRQVKSDLFNDNICIYTYDGNKMLLPKGSTAIDCAYAIHDEIGNHMVGVLVNGQEQSANYILQNNDCVKIIVKSEVLGPDLKWLDIAQTNHARERIKSYYQNR